MSKFACHALTPRTGFCALEQPSTRRGCELEHEGKSSCATRMWKILLRLDPGLRLEASDASQVNRSPRR